jgi:glycerol-3-phosphate dehydrogenase
MEGSRASNLRSEGMNRSLNLQKLQEGEFDLLIIGGGITGTGIALDAQTRGLKTALVEMQDFASGTSSRSTKLIHGGLRYLKKFEFGLVAEVGRERAVVHRSAPHLVHPDKMLLPLLKGGQNGRALLGLGLKIYDWLAGVTGLDRRRMLNRKETLAVEPLLSNNRVEGAGFYAEYRTDDSRLVISVAKTAAAHGAVLANYVKAGEFIYLNDQVRGIKATDVLTGEELLIRAKWVVNAAGPWVDDVRGYDGGDSRPLVRLTKGVHVVVDKSKLPLAHPVYFDSPDGRMIFAIPRGEVVYLGTTDTAFEGDVKNPTITRADAEYILAAANDMFPSAALQLADIESGWAGLRPLIGEAGKPLRELSRKEEIFESPHGLITIAGGKLTGYRKMAEKVVDRVLLRSNLPAKKCQTGHIKLVGGEFENYVEVNEFIEELQSEFGRFADQQECRYLVHNYGREAHAILLEAEKLAMESSEAIATAEAIYAVENEMTESVLDFFERRTGRLNFRIKSIPKVRDGVLRVLADRLKWSEGRFIQENSLLDKALLRVVEWRDK